MRSAIVVAVLSGGLLFAGLPRQAHAGTFNSVNDCVAGMRVQDNGGRIGTITRVDRDWSYCYVRWDDSGKEISYLYSLLSPAASAAGKAAGATAGSSKAAAGRSASKLVVGNYMCWVGTEASAGGLKITGPTTYDADGKAGTYRLEASGAIVFTSGPYASFHGHTLENGRIGLNLSGGTFYNMTCDPPR